MHTAVRLEIFVSVLLLSVLGTCVSQEQEQSCPKICSTLATVQLDAWWMVHGRNYANHRSTRKVHEIGDISDQVLEGRVSLDKWTAGRKEVEGVGAAEKGFVEERKDGINVGEY